MKKVLITGSGGVVGSVLTSGLPHQMTDFDLPEHERDFPLGQESLLPQSYLLQKLPCALLDFIFPAFYQTRIFGQADDIEFPALMILLSICGYIVMTFLYVFS